MALRLYPEPEGNQDKNGKAYPTLGLGQTTAELNILIQTIKEKCHLKFWGLVIHSANDGEHSHPTMQNPNAPISMHYKGLAIDFDCYRLDPKTGRNLRIWVTFEEQKQLLEEISQKFLYNLWAWPDDLGTHSHVSIHPY